MIPVHLRTCKGTHRAVVSARGVMVTNPTLLGYSLELNPGGAYATALADFSVAYGAFGFNCYNAQNIIEAATLDSITNRSAFPDGSASRMWVALELSLRVPSVLKVKAPPPNFNTS